MLFEEPVKKNDPPFWRRVAYYRCYEIYTFVPPPLVTGIIIMTTTTIIIVLIWLTILIILLNIGEVYNTNIRTPYKKQRTFFIESGNLIG
jgi:hypothetical protein